MCDPVDARCERALREENRQLTVKTYSVPEISCGHCKSAIESELAVLKGVDSVEVNVEAKTVTVAFREIAESDVVAAIAEAGYEVTGQAN